MLTYLPLQADPLPIRLDTSGALRVGDTRVTIDSVLQCYLRGDTPEAIVDAFDTLELADVYAVIGHFLRHRTEFDQYLKMYEIQFENSRAAALANGQADLKERLLERLAARKAEDAALSRG
jgi:uncharacterized protein (DUF433 family)